MAASTDILAAAFAEMNLCLAGLDTVALNRRPAGPDSNSLAVLALHSLASARSWACVALGRPLPPRDRDAEFMSEAVPPESLAATVAALQRETLALLREGPLLPWVALRAAHARPDPGAPTDVSGAWALMHAIEHLREHIGQMWLTRQLVGMRPSRSP